VITVSVAGCDTATVKAHTHTTCQRTLTCITYAEIKTGSISAAFLPHNAACQHKYIYTYLVMLHVGDVHCHMAYMMHVDVWSMNGP